ncbi:MAG TPA: hypothetical protein VKV16_03690 [Solirubrobacteraceae bacterium]|nr:hypothetical protein [Solirubrobacteraceae bacterium]
MPLASPTAHAPIYSLLRSERGASLMELLVAMSSATIVMVALITILSFSSGQEIRISDRVQADRTGRAAMTRIIDELHSSCTGFGAAAIQQPSGTPKSPLLSAGPLNLWFISAYGSSTSASAIPSTVYEHDINFTYTGTNSSSVRLGKLTDYTFQSKAGSGPKGSTQKWEFPALEAGNATARVLAKNVIAPEISGKETIFQYYKLNSETGVYSPIEESKISTEAASGAIAKVSIAFQQAPEDAKTTVDRVVPFSNAVVLRLDPAETGSGSSDEPCK